MKRKLQRGLYAPELLESRIAPATFIVTTTADAGAGSLRAAIDGIAGVGGANDSPGTLTIKGPGIDKLTISGANASRIFDIDAGGGLDARVFLATATIVVDGTAFLSNASIDDDGGALRVDHAGSGKITLKNSILTGNLATTTGGGVLKIGPHTLTLLATVITGNGAPNIPNGP